MAKYHVNPGTGKPGLCNATKACPFGGAEAHFGSRVAAQAHYEELMADSTLPPRPKKLSYEEEVKLADELLALAKSEGKRLAEAHPETFKESNDFWTPEQRAYFDAEHRRGMLDAVAGRTGEKWPADTDVSLADANEANEVTTLKADAWAGVLAPGEYEGYAYDPDIMDMAEATIAVYEDGTSRAFKLDVRDNLPLRKKRALEKPAELDALARKLDHELENAKSKEAVESYASAIADLTAASRNTDWTDLEEAANTLDKLDDRSYDYSRQADKFEEDGNEELAQVYEKISDAYGESSYGAYEIGGR